MVPYSMLSLGIEVAPMTIYHPLRIERTGSPAEMNRTLLPFIRLPDRRIFVWKLGTLLVARFIPVIGDFLDPSRAQNIPDRSVIILMKVRWRSGGRLQCAATKPITCTAKIISIAPPTVVR